MYEPKESGAIQAAGAPADPAGGAGRIVPDGAGLAKQYTPSEHEGRVWGHWESSGAFHADPGRVLRGEAEPYCILMPPPNVTDRLHVGHALNNTLQDILVRAHRMMGYETMWMPGTDHAGIATQAVVERRLRAEGKLKGPLREAFTRDQFVAQVQEWKDEYEATITGQLKALGCSCDWARQRFTMDEVCARAVREAFFRLFRDGLIYRGKRLVNWDPVLQTAVADDEVEDIEVDGKFYYLRYPLMHPWDHEAEPTPVTWSELAARGYPVPEGDEYGDDTPAWVTVATTRPETYLGDTAVAVNPRDPRAGALRGLCVELPLVGRAIPVVEDDYVVLPAAMQDDPEAGAKDPKAAYATGFLKVTPAHDPNDYEIGQRHKLRVINIFGPDASISDRHGWDDVGDAHIFVGLSREAGRKKVVEEFYARGLVEAVKPYRHTVAHSDRSKAVIEPYLSDQWYVRVTDERMKGAALDALVSSRGTGVPPVSSHPSRGTLDALVSSRGTGIPPVSSHPSRGTLDALVSSRGTGVPPVSSHPSRGIPNTLTITSRNLPHWQLGGSSYFITFRLDQGQLSEAERSLVLDACRHWDGKRMELHAAVVMPDHAHFILSPFERSPGIWWSLSELLHSIKSFTAHEIAKGRGVPGTVWLDESYDRLIRDGEYGETMAYVLDNPVNDGFVDHWSKYQWSWTTEEARAGRLRFVEQVRGVRRDVEADARGAEEAEERRPDACATGFSIHPERYERTYRAWHESIRDWCISRQLWWGHRIPVWSSPTEWRQASDGVREQRRYGEVFSYLAPLRERGRVFTHFFGVRRGSIETSNLPGEGTHTVFSAEIDPKDSAGFFVCILDPDGADHDAVKFLEARGFTRDPDVLDTWFSSGLWPMSTMGWPEATDLLVAFNPSSTLCTAREIITLWVSRMVMFNRYFMPEEATERSRRAGNGATKGGEDGGKGKGPVPFRDVFIHAMIQDGDGRKMSKSLGNGVDPLDIIASHGTDALRFTLCQMTTHTQDIRLPVKKDPVSGRNTSPKFDLGRNFCNKLWNATRFALGILQTPLTPALSPQSRGEGGNQDAPHPDSAPHPALSPQSRGEGGRSLVDRWMLSRLEAGVREATTALGEFRFSEYAQGLYALLWNDFCDWYLEAIKPTVAASPGQRAVLAHALETIVRLLHPIAPFVTEAIWEHLREVETEPVAGVDLDPSRKSGLLCMAGWPRMAASLRDEAAEREFERVRSLVTAVREVRAQHTVLPKRRITLHAADAGVGRLISGASGLIETLAGIATVSGALPSGPSAPFRFESAELHISDLAEAVDESAERGRIARQAADLEKSIRTLQARLSNPGYTDKAPPAMVQETRDALARAETELAELRKTLG